MATPNAQIARQICETCEHLRATATEAKMTFTAHLLSLVILEASRHMASDGDDREGVASPLPDGSH